MPGWHACGVVVDFVRRLAQVIEFESGGLKYQTLTRSGLTIMFAHMPSQVRNYSIIQVGVSNGATEPITVRPGGFPVRIYGRKCCECDACR